MSLIDHSPEMYERVLGLRVVRAFTDDPITPEQMAAILEAARWTGSSKNRQGWEFIVVDGEQLGALAEAGDFTDPLRNSTATLALVQTPDGNPFDIGRVAQNVMLAAITKTLRRKCSHSPKAFLAGTRLRSAIPSKMERSDCGRRDAPEACEVASRSTTSSTASITAADEKPAEECMSFS